MTRTKQLYVSILVLGLAVAFQAMSFELPGKGRMVPLLVGWIAIVLCALDIVAHTDTAFGRWIARVLSGTAHRVSEERRGPGVPAELAAFFWVVFACAGVIVFGFLWAVPVYVFAYMLFYGRKGAVQSGLTALCATLFLWVVFELLLEYEIYRGILFSDL